MIIQDAQEFVLISLVLLFCPDLLDLQERRVVEDIQTKFAVLLHKYLKKRSVFSLIFSRSLLHTV